MGVPSQLRRAGLRVVAEAVAFRRRLAAGRGAVDGAAIRGLRSRIERLPAPPAPASEEERLWHAYRTRFRHDVLTKDPRRFLRWPVLRPMYKRDAPHIRRWLAYLKAHPDWPSRWRPAVEESPVGDPRPYFEYRPSSGNLLYQAYQVCRFEDVTGARLSDVDFVLEFGGGYGALCRLVYALGFRGTYAIYDFPEYSALQDFYLEAHGLRRPTIATPSTLDDLDDLLTRRAPGRAALVALWSLSETPPPLRDEIMRRVSAFDVFVLGYQPRFGTVDNTAWFDAVRARLADGVDWHDVPLPQHPGFVRHLFGTRRESARRR